MKRIIELQINSEIHQVTVKPDTTLLHVLREDLGLIGTKKGCDTGGCGCCTVLIDGKAIYSCMLFAMSARGKSILTIEGVAVNGILDPLQQAFIDAGAVQCGYCTCGMIMAAEEFIRNTDSHVPTDEEVRHAIAGNLCRCTGYQKIVDAIKLASGHIAAAAKG